MQSLLAENSVIILKNWLLILINAGAAIRIIACAIRIMHSEDEKTSQVKRIKNTLIIVSFCNLIVAFKDVLLGYLT